MKKFIYLSIVFLFLLYFKNNEDVLATRTKRASVHQPTDIIWQAKILANATPTDPRMQPQKYCLSTCSPTVRPSPQFDAHQQAKDLYNAIYRLNTDEHKMLDILTRHGMIQRLQLAAAYKDFVVKEKKLKRDNILYHLNKHSDGAWRRSIMVLLFPLPALFAKALNEAIAPGGTDHLTLVEILGTISNFGIKSIDEYYQMMYMKTTLEFDVAKDTTGSFQKVLVSYIKGKRDESQKVDNGKATADAQALNGPGAKPWKAKPAFEDIFGTRNDAHLRQVFTEYKKISHREIEDDIKKEFPGPEGEGLLALTKCIRSKAKFLAERLDEVIRTKKGKNFDDPAIRILVSRSEIDMGDIKVEYEKLYKKSLHSSIAGKIGGDYRRTLTNMILGVPAPPPAAGPPKGK